MPKAKKLETDETRPAITESLNCDAIDVTTRSYDFSSATWSESLDADGTGWEVIYPTFEDADAEECSRFLDSCGRDVPPRSAHLISEEGAPEEFDDDAHLEELREACEKACEEARDDDAYSPMMSYAWPIPGCDLDGANALRLALDGECMTLVSIDGEPHLALTGGGMDLSWSIARSYVALGYWPPATLTLPDFAESHFDYRLALILAESQRIAETWIARKRERTAQLIEKARADGKKART